jgi:ADP-heptose:LPS heptosyltransferase
MDARLDPPPGLLVRWVAWVGNRVLALKGADPPRPEEIRRVLVVRTDDRVGNALLTIPLARALQRALPHAEVDLLLARRPARVAEGLEGLPLVLFEKRDSFAHPLRFLRFVRALRARYDVVFDAAHWHSFSLTSALLSRWAARRWVVGFRREPVLLYRSTVALPEAGVPEAAARLALGEPLGLRLRGMPMETSLGRGQSPVGGRFAALNPGARKADHLWPAARFGALARGLREAFGLRSAVFWGPGEEALARATVAASGGAADLAPPTDLEVLAAAFRSAELVVTNDTGPMHLAVACGARVVAVFLDETGLRWAHPGPRFEAVVAPADERPVLAAAGRLLDTARPGAQPPRSREGLP